MKRRYTTCYVGLLVIAACGLSAQPIYAQASDSASPLEEFLTVAEVLDKSLTGLAGRIDADAEQERQVWIAVADKFARDPNAKRYFERARRAAKASGASDEKEIFLAVLIDIACHNLNDGCQFRRDIAALRTVTDELGSRLDGHDRQFEDVDRRFADMEQQGRAWGSHYRAPTPTPVDPEPRLAPEPALPVERIQEIRLSRVWTGPVHYMVGDAARLCSHAVLLEKCVDVQADDGSVWHGDILQDCQGRIALLPHVKTH